MLVGMCGYVVGYQKTHRSCRWLEEAGFLELPRPDKKMVNKLLKVLKMETSDLRNINGIGCLAAPDNGDERRYLGNSWTGGCRSSRVCQSWSSAVTTGRACEHGSLSHLSLPLKLPGFSACLPLSDPTRGVTVGTLLDYLIPWNCNSTCMLKIILDGACSNVPIKSNPNLHRA